MDPDSIPDAISARVPEGTSGASPAAVTEGILRKFSGEILLAIPKEITKDAQCLMVVFFFFKRFLSLRLVHHCTGRGSRFNENIKT